MGRPLWAQIQTSVQGWEFPLETGEVLLWNHDQSLFLRQGGELKALPLSSESSVALPDPGLEERDLGSGKSQKKYLRGKKNPTGRALSWESRERAKVPEQTRLERGGVTFITTRYENGAVGREFIEAERRELYHFDRHRGLISQSIVWQRDDMRYELEQWKNGSYERRWEQGGRKLRLRYDAGSGERRWSGQGFP